MDFIEFVINNWPSLVVDPEFLLVMGLAALLALIPAVIAHRRGRNPVLWWLFGLFLFVVALPLVLVLNPRNVKRCPDCAELIKSEATKCRFCGHVFGGPGRVRREDWTL
ncbi:MAG: hypothetical protein HY663_06780 [Chloroflexi bacterium]|nr:hypothetical protein [Chloroflexota bacterium]